MRIDKKGLRARLDDIYKWSVKSGVATVTPNSLRVQWDKVIEELSETLLHVYFGDKRKLIDDIGDVFIAFINLLNMDKKEQGVFKKDAEKMDRVAAQIKLSAREFKFYSTTDKSFLLDCIFSTLREAHRLKRINAKDSDLFRFLNRLLQIYCLTNGFFGLKITLRNCIYASYCEIQGRQYEIRVR